MAVRSSTPSAAARYCIFRAIFPVPRAPYARSRTRLHAISRCASSRCRSLSHSVCSIDISACPTPPQRRSLRSFSTPRNTGIPDCGRLLCSVSDSSLVLQYVVHKVHAPSFVYLFRLSAFYSVESAFLATASFADLKMLLTVDSQKLLVVDIFTE